MFKKILVAYDGSDGAKHALKVAIDIAVQYNAELCSLSVEEGVPRYAVGFGEVDKFRKEVDEFCRKISDEAKAIARKQGIELRTNVEAGHEVETIINFVKHGKFDLLVIGFTGHSKIFGGIWGSTSQNITRLSPCTVLLVK